MKRSTNHMQVQLASLVGLYFGMVLCAFAAENVGTVMNLDGTLSAKSSDGSLKTLSVKSEISSGDTLITGRESYARIKFPDGAEIALIPKTQFKVESYHYNEKQPEKDSAGFNLLKGGLRAISGLVGKRGDPDSYRVKTQAATAGIRGTHFGLLFCRNDCGDIKTAEGKTPENGLHTDVAEGEVIINNEAGSQLVKLGQFAYVRDDKVAPVQIPPAQATRVEPPARIVEGWAKSRVEEQKVAPKPSEPKPGEQKAVPKPGEDGIDGKGKDLSGMVINAPETTQCLAQ